MLRGREAQHALELAQGMPPQIQIQNLAKLSSGLLFEEHFSPSDEIVAMWLHIFRVFGTISQGMLSRKRIAAESEEIHSDVGRIMQHHWSGNPRSLPLFDISRDL